MFGYIKPFKPQMRFIEYDVYQSFYCGLCKEMGRKYGVFSRLTLSYDLSFLSLLKTAVNGDMPKIKNEGCLFNPLKKKCCCQCCDGVSYSSDIAMILFYYKVKDNIHDESFFKKCFWHLAYPFAKSFRKKAIVNNGELEKYIGEKMSLQSELEKEKCSSIDMAAEPTALSLSKIFEDITTDEIQKRILSRLGYFLGKYVYFCDAYDDLQDDFKNKSYNPFIISNNISSINQNTFEQFSNEIKSVIYLNIAETIKAYDLLEIKCYKPVLDNIFYLGLKSVVNSIELKHRKTFEKTT